jgi:diguanylate cyclase (GGDEF)-like protein
MTSISDDPPVPESLSQRSQGSAHDALGVVVTASNLQARSEPPSRHDEAARLSDRGSTTNDKQDGTITAARGPDGTVHRSGVSRFRVRTLMLAVVALPSLALAALVASTAASSWNDRVMANRVQQAVTLVTDAGSARVVLEHWVLPAEAIAYANSLGVSTATLDRYLGIDFAAELVPATRAVAHDPFLALDAHERADRNEVVDLMEPLLRGTAPFPVVDATYRDYATRANGWFSLRYEALERSVAAWHPPGSFVLHVETLDRVFKEYLDQLDAIDYANFVLSGRAAAEEKAKLVQAVAGSDLEATALAEALGPRAHAVWQRMEQDPRVRSFRSSLDEATLVAIGGSAAPFVSNLSAYAAAFRNGLVELDDLDHLMLAAGADLTAVTQHERGQASDAFVIELCLLIVLLGIAIGGALLLATSVAMPVRRLGDAAAAVEQGEFTVPPLAERGPLEVSVASHAFNDMMAMLRGLEAKVVALAAEDLADPVLTEPMPGRAGEALQRVVDDLAARVRERERERQHLALQATHDHLTGLLNRAALFEVLERDLTRRRGEGEVIGVVFVDLDGLKAINDGFGHEAGDRAIKMASEAMLGATRQGDVVARLGGDEFVVVVHVHKEPEARMVAERIQRAVERRSLQIPGTDIEVLLSCSVGVAVETKGSARDPMALVREADADMYRQKTRVRRAAATKPHNGVRTEAEREHS